MELHIDNNTVTITGCQIQRDDKREAIQEAKRLTQKLLLSLIKELYKDAFPKKQPTDGGHCQNQSGMACPELSVPVTSYDVTI